jgi:hypothetical protein
VPPTPVVAEAALESHARRRVKRLLAMPAMRAARVVSRAESAAYALISPENQLISLRSITIGYIDQLCRRCKVSFLTL